ncbi:restriction endonuclease subunit S [Zongyangia hominis]|uniref:Restriction endonuclease subunit S n=1 Tax=Zongyangia hominis TaxID=2763677 RepID=A0A926ECM4_9FIRM|nr:restriction endonuclease subunit S [Zongyangia hominis]MBC8569929.1 restriction endonuclease subunit S [Zongyangia hominis]
MVKAGYKNTEIGAIPEEWETKTFENCFTILPNNTLSRAELTNNGGEVRNIHYGDILIKYPSVLDCALESIPYVNSANVAKISKGFLQNGDIIFADTAEDSIVGKAVEVTGIKDDKIVSGLHTIPCRPNASNMFERKWLGYYINHAVYHDQLLPFITGTKVSAISKGAILETVIAIPPKEEQQNISTALSDIDSLIVSLEKLIAKKKAIKQGAMQELLTKKRRLPGFSGEWKVVTVREIGKIVTGSTPSRQVGQYWNGDFCWISAQDFNGKYIKNTAEKISDEGKSRCRILPKGTVLVTCIASIGLNSIALMECATNQQINAIICNDGYYNEFVYYLISHNEKNMRLLAGQTAFPIISKKQFEEFTLYLPLDKKEQVSIATVLSDMDNEIEALEKKLAKYKGFKSGMMSELFTGRIRLIDKEKS